MSSLNPFAARRERKEEQVKEKLSQLQQHQQGGGSAQLLGGGSDMAAASMGSLALPETTYESEDFDKYLPASSRVDQQPPSWNARQASSPTYYEPPSRAWQCFYKLQNGFVIGASLGGAVGFLYGTWASFAYKHILYLPIAVVQSGGFFGLFLACGTVIRCEETGAVIALRDASITEQHRRARACEDMADCWGTASTLNARGSPNAVLAAVTPSSPSYGAGRSAVAAAILADY